MKKLKKKCYIIIGISVLLISAFIIRERNLRINQRIGNVPTYYLIGTVKKIETDYIYVDVEKIKSEGSEVLVSLNMCINIKKSTMDNVKKDEKVEIFTFDNPRQEDCISAYRITNIENRLE